MGINSTIQNKDTLAEPVRPLNLPDNCQWLAGEGAGSWFCIESVLDQFRVSRFRPLGVLECKGMFEITNHSSFDIHSAYRFTYLSHCKRVALLQRGQTIQMQLIK